MSEAVLQRPVVQRAGRIVIIEDTEDMRQILRIALRRGGFDVVGEAANGATGVSEVKAAQPDLVLLDLDLPVLDGFAALPLVRLAAPHAKVVVFSHSSSAQTRLRVRRLGADGYLRKGASLADVLEIAGLMCDQDVSRPDEPDQDPGGLDHRDEGAAALVLSVCGAGTPPVSGGEHQHGLADAQEEDRPAGTTVGRGGHLTEAGRDRAVAEQPGEPGAGLRAPSRLHPQASCGGSAGPCVDH